MLKKYPKLTTLLILLFLALLYFGRGQVTPAAPQSAPEETLSLVSAPAAAAQSPQLPDENGSYTTAEDLVLYLQSYGRLPPNFVRKGTARAAGWDGGALEPIMPGKCIGGDSFGNREGLLPDAPGRVWRECDVNTLYAYTRGPERLIYSNDGLIYYSPDHYESFTLLAGSP